ncbi:MAG: elongation factor G [Coriobacteriales bacterium]|jgi:elongation factor G
MGAPETDKVRNVVLVGQGGVGKTSLAEAMLHLTGKTARLGGHGGSKPTLDYDPEETKRNFSISTSIAPVEYKGFKINVLDAPCYPDFIGDAYAALSVAETALFVVDAAEGPQPTTVKLWYAAEDLPLARAIFINRVDRDNVHLEQTLEVLKERFGTRLGLMSVPMGTGPDFEGVIDVLRMEARTYRDGKGATGPIPDEYKQAAQEAYDRMIDLIVEADDDMMMKYFDGQTLTTDEVEKLMSEAIAKRLFVPVYAGSAVQEQGVEALLDDIVTYFPSPLDYGEMPLADGTMLKISSADERPVAFVFKTLADPSAGRLSFVKVLAGTLDASTELICARTQKKERLGHLYLMCGRERTDVNHALAGDIIVVPKLDANTGDTLSTTGKVEAEAFRFPNSLYQVAIRAKNRNDEGKLGDFLDKACDADPTISVSHNEETHQTIISAIGEAQVSVLVNRLGERTGVEAVLEPIKIAYRETIRKAASAQGRHKKQTGGAGQFGDCWLRVEPNPGGGYEFVDEVVGGAIPRQFIPAVDKGVQEAMAEGVLAGYPMVDIRVACYDGSYHPVDSSEIAFKTAARIGFRAACERADMVILEPMANLVITVPDAYAGAITGDVPASRGRITSIDSDGKGNTIVSATVPFAEVTDYSTRLRSLSRGTGEYTIELNGYEQVPHDTAQKLIDAHKREVAEGGR